MSAVLTQRESALVNAVYPDDVDIWLRLVRGGDSRELHVHPLSKSGMPEWLLEMLSDDELSFALNPPRYGIGDGWATWGLALGIAPGQPFLARLGKPRGYRDYWGEYDVDYEGEVLAVARWPHERVLRQWKSYLAWSYAETLLVHGAAA